MDELQQTLKLTDNEYRALRHRLQVSDGITDALTDCEDAEWTEDQVATIAELLEVGKLTEANTYNAELTKDVLAECVEGSTWIACAECESDAMETKARRTMNAVSRKVSTYIGREVDVPSC